MDLAIFIVVAILLVGYFVYDTKKTQKAREAAAAAAAAAQKKITDQITALQAQLKALIK